MPTPTKHMKPMKPMRFALYIAAGTLAVGLTAAPATADPQTVEPQTTGRQTADQQTTNPQTAAQHPRHTEGRVTARGGLKLRDKPTRSSRVIRIEPYGATVHIFCKTTGDHVGGNDHWYLLTDGTWAWGSARYIVPKGNHSPRWC